MIKVLLPVAAAFAILLTIAAGVAYNAALASVAGAPGIFATVSQDAPARSYDPRRVHGE